MDVINPNIHKSNYQQYGNISYVTHSSQKWLNEENSTIGKSINIGIGRNYSCDIVACNAVSDSRLVDIYFYFIFK